LTTVIQVFKNPATDVWGFWGNFCTGKSFMPRRIFWSLLVTLGMIVSASVSLYSQSTYGSIAGSVTDTSGAAITDANVTLTNLGTQEKRTQSSGADGLFTFVNLFPGQYRIDVEKQGFKHFVRNPITVQVQQDTRIDAALQVGEVSQVVEVTSETPLLQAETSSLGQVVEERKANELPLNGRNIFNLITVSPGAVAQGGSGGSPVGQNPFSWGNYQIGGSFANQGAEYLDGQPLNIGYINLPIIIPTQDSVGEFKVQYSNLGAEWGKFSGGVVNLSTKSGTNSWHGSGYEYFRNKVLNANEYFNKASELASGSANTPPPWTQNQYGFQVGGPVIKDKTFFYVSWEQYRQRTGSPFTTTVPQAAMLTGDFSSLCTLPVSEGGAGGTFNGGICSNLAGQLYDPYGATATGDRTGHPYPNNQIPASEFSTATQVLWKTYFPAPNSAGDINNFISAAPAGGNTNEFVARGDQNIGSNTRLFGRFAYFGLTDLPVNPFGTGLCLDRCAEKYHSKLIAVGVNHTFTPTTILDVNIAASRFVYGRQPILSGFDLTTLGWPATYNTPGSSMRTPPTPAFPFPNDVGKSQGNSAIGDHNTQYNVSPVFTLIRGKHTIQAGGQVEWGLDNYFQTNIASGAFAFGGNWTTAAAGASNPDFAFADFLLGLSQNEGNFVNQTEGVAQVPAQTKGSQVYRALFADDTWHLTPKLTVNLGLRYELQGTWSDAYKRLSYWDPLATNSVATGCGGTAGTPCPGDAFLVGTGRNTSNNNIPMDKKAFSPRLGFAFSADPKTVIRGGYGIFYIPNYVSFGLNPDNDFVNLASTPLHATNDGFITPAAMLDGDDCGYTSAGFTGTSVFTPRGPNGFGCTQSGPFGNSGILPPPGRNFAPLAGTLAPFPADVSSFALFTASPNLAPYYGATGHGNPQWGYVEQWNFDIQRQLPAGFFADVAYAGSHGVHLEQYQTEVNQLPDTLWSQGAALSTQVTNPMAGTNPNPSLNGAMIAAGQLERAYPEYNQVQLAGFGCCSSTYNSLQATVTRRFQGGGTLLVAYTNAKLLSNTDTLTSWLEGPTGGVPGVQDWDNLNGEKSLSAQDVSQRLVISYVLDLPFGHGKMFANNFTGVMNGVVSGWGVNGITTFQRGFPLKISYSGSTPLEQANLGVSNIRPDVVPGCDKKAGGGHITNWFNTACFVTPPNYGPGSESRVDPTLRGPGINNFDFALFKQTKVSERLGVEFRAEFFNIFNHPYFSQPATGCGNDSIVPQEGLPCNTGAIGVINSTIQGGVASPERLVQLVLKFVF
jgi:hypothetical protein